MSLHPGSFSSLSPLPQLTVFRTFFLLLEVGTNQNTLLNILTFLAVTATSILSINPPAAPSFFSALSLTIFNFTGKINARISVYRDEFGRVRKLYGGRRKGKGTEGEQLIETFVLV